jgi:DNA (cytosine-5)-methyltransferase 1
MKRHGTQTKTSGRTVKLHKLRTGHLFAGAGGGILADLLLGHQPIFAVEIEDYPRKVLEQRQADGVLPFFPTFGDIKDFDGTPWRGTVDVLCGGFPCQDISAAGKGAGITGERSGLWKEYARLIGEMRPRFVFAENSPLLRTRGLGVVLEDLAALGYNARWGVLGARDVGAPHKRDRMWVLAWRRNDTNASSFGWNNGCNHREERPILHNQDGNAEEDKPKRDKRLSGTWDARSNVAYSDLPQREGAGQSIGSYPEHADSLPSSAWWGKDPAEIPKLGLGRMADGVANRVDRLKAIGNGQVPMCAAMAFSILSEGLI